MAKYGKFINNPSLSDDIKAKIISQSFTNVDDLPQPVIDAFIKYIEARKEISHKDYAMQSLGSKKITRRFNKLYALISSYGLDEIRTVAKLSQSKLGN